MFGRRSLLWHPGNGLDEPFLLTSAACAGTVLEGKGDQPFWSEVPAVGVFYASVKEMCEGKPSLHCYPWKQCGQWLMEGIPDSCAFIPDPCALTVIYISFTYIGSLYQDGLCNVLRESATGRFAVRVVHCDSLTISLPPLNKDLPDEIVTPVDPLEVAGEQGALPHGTSRHKCTAEDTTCQQQGSVSTVKGQLMSSLATTFEGDDSGGGSGFKECSEKGQPAVVPMLPGPTDPSSVLLGLLKQAVDRRVYNLPPPLDVKAAGGGAGTGARVGILFSGGVDSVVMAALADLLAHFTEMQKFRMQTMFLCCLVLMWYACMRRQLCDTHILHPCDSCVTSM